MPCQRRDPRDRPGRRVTGDNWAWRRLGRTRWRAHREGWECPSVWWSFRHRLGLGVRWPRSRNSSVELGVGSSTPDKRAMQDGRLPCGA